MVRTYPDPVIPPVGWALIVSVDVLPSGRHRAHLDCGHRQIINRVIRTCILWNGLPWGMLCRQCRKQQR